jgi:hypothetical protein
MTPGQPFSNLFRGKTILLSCAKDFIKGPHSPRYGIIFPTLQASPPTLSIYIQSTSSNSTPPLQPLFYQFFNTISFNSNEMDSFTTLASVISMALFASAAPAVMEARGPPPPTSSALDFTLFKADAGQEYQCYNNVADLHVPPADLGNCHTAPTFYNARIWDQAWGYTCKRMLFPLKILSLKRLADGDCS